MRFFRYHIARIDNNNGTTVFVDLSSHVDADYIKTMPSDDLKKFCTDSLRLIYKREPVITKVEIKNNDLIIRYGL